MRKLIVIKFSPKIFKFSILLEALIKINCITNSGKEVFMELMAISELLTNVSKKQERM